MAGLVHRTGSAPIEDPVPAISTATTMTGTSVDRTEKGVLFTGADSRRPTERELPRYESDTRPGSPELPPPKFRRSKTTPLIREAGESGRRGFHPMHFFRVTFMSNNPVSRVVNVLWPLVPAAIAVRYALPDNHLLIFILSYLAIVPCANLIGFAAQELARKAPHVFGVLTETT